jgi:hypothetical protein
MATVFNLLHLFARQADPNGQHFGVPSGRLAQLLQARTVHPIHGRIGSVAWRRHVDVMKKTQETSENPVLSNLSSRSA